MLNRFSAQIKRMGSSKRALTKTVTGLVAVHSLCETIVQYTPMARAKPTLASEARKTFGTLKDGRLFGDQPGSSCQVDSSANPGVDPRRGPRAKLQAEPPC